MIRLKPLLLASTMLVWSMPAHADPVSILTVIGAVVSIGGPTNLLALGGIGIYGSIATGVSAALGFAALAAAQIGISSLLKPSAPSVPKPEDGKYNLRQNVPSRVHVYGRVKKSADYIALEEKDGTVYHVLAHAAHRIEGYVQHWLHDDPVTIDGSGNVVSYTDGEGNEQTDQYILSGTSKVNILEREGLDAETAYSEMTTAFPTIWSAAHRGDGIASVLMRVTSVDANNYTKVFPQGMPSHSAVLDGALLYDPRTETTSYSKNLALIRRDHLLQPFGARLSTSDLDEDDWEAAANVCDEDVTNRDDETEKRYHGGFWFRYENDPVDVGRTIDQAGELVLYETAQGKIGVHPGKWVEPDITLEKRDIKSLRFDANRRRASNVIAVRGRFTNPDKQYNTDDAAIYGDPYASGETERSKTVENTAVQSHNHMQRLQKLAYIRARAPRVSITCDYEPARNLPYRRFVKVNCAPKLSNAYVEIIGRPKLSLKSMQYSFEGIVVPSTLFDFDASTEEGAPGSPIVQIVGDGIPDVENFSPTIQTETLTSGGTAAYCEATFTRASDALGYEMQYVPTAGGATQTVLAGEGESVARSGYLVDNVEYKFRMRARSTTGTPGDWTAYVTLTAVADATAPDAPTGVDATGGSGSATVTWTNPNSPNFVSLRIYRGTTATFGSSTLIATLYTGAETYDDTGLSADDYYYWVTSANGSGVESSEVAASSNPVTVT